MLVLVVAFCSRYCPSLFAAIVERFYDITPNGVTDLAEGGQRTLRALDLYTCVVL